MNQGPGGAQQIPIALIDDHTLVRKGLAELLNSVGGYCVKVEAGNGQEMIRALADGATVSMAIVDLNMPIMNGYETLHWLRENRPDIRTIALTFECTEEAVMKAMRNGARGYLLKDIEPTELKIALDAVMHTGFYHTDLVHSSLMQNVGKRTAPERLRAELFGQLTAREVEFLTLVCDPMEHTYEGIAAHMNVSRRTVDGYRENLFQKFGVKSKTGLVLVAMRLGLIT